MSLQLLVFANLIANLCCLFFDLPVHLSLLSKVNALRGGFL